MARLTIASVTVLIILFAALWMTLMGVGVAVITGRGGEFLKLVWLGAGLSIEKVLAWYHSKTKRGRIA